MYKILCIAKKKKKFCPKILIQKVCRQTPLIRLSDCKIRGPSLKFFNVFHFSLSHVIFFLSKSHVLYFSELQDLGIVSSSEQKHLIDQARLLHNSTKPRSVGYSQRCEMSRERGTIIGV